jgi:hypothetical protein
MNAAPGRQAVLTAPSAQDRLVRNDDLIRCCQGWLCFTPPTGSSFYASEKRASGNLGQDSGLATLWLRTAFLPTLDVIGGAMFKIHEIAVSVLASLGDQ